MNRREKHIKEERRKENRMRRRERKSRRASRLFSARLSPAEAPRSKVTAATRRAAPKRTETLDSGGSRAESSRVARLESA